MGNVLLCASSTTYINEKFPKVRVVDYIYRLWFWLVGFLTQRQGAHLVVGRNKLDQASQ